MPNRNSRPHSSPYALAASDETDLPMQQPSTAHLSLKTLTVHGLLFILSMISGTLVALSRKPCSSSIPPDPNLRLQSQLGELPVFGSGNDSLTHKSVRLIGNPDSQSPFKGPPSAAVDAAWDSLWSANILLSSEEYAASFPQYPEAGVKASNEQEDAYFATLESTHQLHCLYTLFRASYVDYYEPERKFLSHNPLRYHSRLDHCTDILRQKLMCDGDSRVVTYNWVQGNKSPVANYNVLRQCRNYQMLLDWSEGHAATGARFSKDGDTTELDSDP